MVWAISSGVPTRFTGTPEIKPALLSAVPVKRFSMSVSIGPGATALTRTPDSATFERSRFGQAFDRVLAGDVNGRARTHRSARRWTTR